MTQRNTPDTLAWFKHQHDIGSTDWQALCLKLQRSGRNLPGVFPSAFAAMMGTPMSERVYDRDKWQQGMVVYIDDPHDSNTFGHIAGLRVNKKNGTWLVWTNDAFVRGGVSCVDVDWFKPNWGDPVQFAATSLNGFDLILPQKPVLTKPSKHPVKVPKKATMDNYDYAIHRLEKAMAYHHRHNHPRYVAALEREIANLRKIQKGVLK